MLQRIITSLLLVLVGIGGFFVNVDINIQSEYIRIHAWIDLNTTYAACLDPRDPWCTTAANSFVGPPASAAWWSTAWWTTAAKNEVTTWTNQFIALINTFLGVLTIIVTPAIILASWLMSPDWTSGDLFGLREIMYSVWITVSNIMYFIYAILLIIIALGTIFGSDKFGYKVLLPRLALGILMVPFSWWFVQWTVSLSTIVTASVLSIPADILEEKDKDGWWATKNIPKNITIDASKSDKENAKAINCAKDSSDCTSYKEFVRQWGGIYGSLLVYAYWVFKLDSFDTIDNVLDGMKSWWQVINQVLIWVLMFIVFGILVIALIFMLLIRAIKLWMYAMFSPLFTLHFVLGKELMSGDKMEDFSLKEFIGLAFVPAVVWLTLSFGLVILSAMQSPGVRANNGVKTIPTGMCTPSDIQWAGCQIIGLFW
jgi:hypothetical protein